MTATLDWRDARHWNRGRVAECVRCSEPTHLLDDAGRPSHKSCAELEVRGQAWSSESFGGAA